MVDYEANLKSIKQFFEDLLIIQYKTKRNKAFIDLLVDIVFSNMIIQKIENETVSIDSEGVNLDVTGKWVGVDRLFSNIDLWTRKYFALPSYKQIRENNYNEWQGGFSLYSNFKTLTGAWLMYLTYVSVHTQAHKLGDEYYRFLIRLKIISNSINHTRKNIDEAMYYLTDNEIYTTWGNMCVTYNVSSRYKQIMDVAYNKDILPAPTGCDIKVVEYKN